MNILEIRFKNGEKKWFGDKLNFFINIDGGELAINFGEHRESYSLNDVEKVLCGGEVVFGEYEPPCPLTNSPHEKALVRVVEKEDGMYTKDVIQVLCSCGHIISENEIK